MARLGDIATYINGYAFKPEDWGTDGLPILRIQDLTGSSYETNRYNGKYDPKYEVIDGDVLISWSASLGVYVWDGEKALLNQHIFKVVFNKVPINKSFFVHQVQGILEKASSETHGATMKHLTKPVFDALPFYLPPMEKQNHIASVLDKVGDLIALRKQQLAKLDELIKARFVEMFGDIHNSKLYPYIPLKSITNVISGGTPSRDVAEYWKNGNIPWVKTTELQNNMIEKTEETITLEGLEMSSAKMVPSGTVLIAMYGQGKTRGMTAFLTMDAATNQACACLLPSETINQKYLWFYFMLSYDELRELAEGGNQPNLSVGILKNFPILLPPKNLQNKFAAFVEQIGDCQLTIQRGLDKLEMLKKALMQEYFG